MKWRKAGVVYVPDGKFWWAKVGAQMPTLDRISPDVLRVYYLSKDLEGFGRIGFVDVAAEDPTHVLDVSPEPILDLGEREPSTIQGFAPTESCKLGGKDIFTIKDSNARSACLI